MRLPVALSLLLHALVVALVARLPAIPAAPKSRPIEVDVGSPQRAVETPPPQLRLPQPPEVAMRTRALSRERALVPKLPAREKEREEPEPPPPAAQRESPAGPVSPERRSGPVDLTLHSLPTVPGGEGVVLPSGGGGGPAAPRREWRPRGDAGDPITGKVADAKVERYPLESLGRDGFLYNGPQFKAHIALDGSVSFDDKNIRDFNGTSGSFDLTDLFMKGKKQDPYRHEKEKFLAATQAKRDELTKRARAERLGNALASLPRHLERVWSDRSRSARERRELLFQLWQEAATSDDEMGHAGAQARGTIEAFIRSRLPQGSEEAFTEEELAAYNRGRRDRFAPYE